MSVDFVIFVPTAAPREAKMFRTWYYQQTDWDDGVVDADPAILAPPLRAWYDAMIKTFPDATRSDAEGPEAIEYSFNPNFMYCCMPATSTANLAWQIAQNLAEKFGLGTYDCMSDNGRNNGTIVFPDGPLANELSFLQKLFLKAKR